MSDEPTDGTTGPGEPNSDDSTAEIPAVPASGDAAPSGEPYPIDEEMLAAFLGEARPATSSASDETVAMTSASDETVAMTSASDETVAMAAVDVPTPEEDVQVSEAVAVEVVEPADEPAAAPEPITEAIAEPTPPRRSAWATTLTVTGIVLIAAAVGAAGVVVGRMTAPDPGVVISTQDTVEEDAVSPLMPVGPLPVPAPGTLIVTTARVPSSTWPVVLTAVEPLSDDTGTAPGYRLVNRGISGAQVASILASTFGATGSVTTTDTGWEVGSESAPRVVVINDPLFSWAYEDAAALATTTVGTEFAAVEAISLTTDTLTGIGVDISSVEYEVGVQDGRTVVSAWQVVGGQRTQLGWRFVFDSDGTILAASGFSSGFEAVPDYPVVGAATAVTRSQQSPWTALPASPITGPTDGSAPTAAASPSSTGGPTVDLPLSSVDVVSAELGLAQYWQPDGSILLLPSYILTGADGSTWSLLAVAEPAVSFVPRPFPLSEDAVGFVAEPFPSSAPDLGDELGESMTDPLDSEPSLPPLEDDGMVDESGEPVIAPTEDPAASQ